MVSMKGSTFILSGIFTVTSLSLLSLLIYRQQLEDKPTGDYSFKNPLSEWHVKVIEYSQLYKVNWSCEIGRDESPWQLAESWMTHREVTGHDSIQNIGCVLNALNKRKIIHADVGSKGTQLKATLTLDGGQRVVFKPKFYDRDYVMVGSPYAGKDRHNAEIAAFHLNRIIGLNKAPLIIGRSIDLEFEVRAVAHKNLLNTFFYRDGSSCFYGRCHYCKGPDTGVCANRTVLEGSITLWLPESYKLGPVQRHPWMRTYRPNKVPKWLTDENYCQSVIEMRPYETPPRLLDLIDISVFDYLISNADRHHYETFEYTKDSTVVALDNGKAFGNPYVDEFTILAPLYQCCRIRESTYNKLMPLKDGVLGQVLYNVLFDQPLAPLLTLSHYKAVDRRLKKVLDTIDNCLLIKDRSKVLVDDGYF